MTDKQRFDDDDISILNVLRGAFTYYFRHLGGQQLLLLMGMPGFEKARTHVDNIIASTLNAAIAMIVASFVIMEAHPKPQDLVLTDPTAFTIYIASIMAFLVLPVYLPLLLAMLFSWRMKLCDTLMLAASALQLAFSAAMLFELPVDIYSEQYVWTLLAYWAWIFWRWHRLPEEIKDNRHGMRHDEA